MENNSENNEQVQENLTVAQVQEFLETNPEGKSWLDSQKDKHANKYLETFKTNQLPKYKQQWEQEKNPKSAAEIELSNLKNEIETMKKEKAHSELKSNAIKYLSDNQMSNLNDLADYFISDDNDKTINGLSKLQEAFNNAVQAAVEAKIKINAYTPPNQTKGVQHTGNSLQDAVRAKLFGK